MRIETRYAVLLMAPCVALMLIAYLAPFGSMFISSFKTIGGEPTLANYMAILGDAFYWRVALDTFRISLWVTLFSLIIGYPLAYYMTFQLKSRLVKRLIYVVIVTPLFTSNIVRSFGWMVILGRRGLINESLSGIGLIDRPLQLLFNETGIIVGMTYIMLPFMVLTISAVLQSFDMRLAEASDDLGANPIATFYHIVFPLGLPGVIAGSLIVFTLSVSAYVTPSVLSGNKVTVMSMVIFQQYGSTLNLPFGAALSAFLLASTLLLIGMAMAVVNRGPAPTGGH